SRVRAAAPARRRPGTPAGARPRARRPRPRTGGCMTLTTELMSEAVVAGYVRDISTRHAAPRPWRSHGRPARPSPTRSRRAQAPIAGTRQHHRLRPRPRVELHAEQPP